MSNLDLRSLLKRPWTDPDIVTRARAAVGDGGAGDPVGAGRILGEAGCGYEAAKVLRPLRKRWREEPWAAQARSWLDAATWWNKSWREFATLRNAGEIEDALSLLGSHFLNLWDFPPLLMHLAAIAFADDDLELAGHIYERIAFLADRGVKGISTAAFSYLSQARLIEIQALSGDPAGALERFAELTHNPGNAHHYEMLLADLTVLAGDLDRAMVRVAECLKKGREERQGYSRELRERWAAESPRLEPLRRRADWQSLVEDPRGWLAG